LPVVFLCENNQYGMSSRIDDMVAIKHLSSRAAAYGFPGVTVDGNDLGEVIHVADEAVARDRSGKGSYFIGAETYRLSGHSKNEKEAHDIRMLIAQETEEALHFAKESSEPSADELYKDVYA